MTPSSRRLRLSPETENDLSAILQHSLEMWGQIQQDAGAEACAAAFASLVEFPELGRERSDLFSGLRSYRVRRHMIYSQYGRRELSVARILHGRADTMGELEGYMPAPDVL